MTMDGTIKSLFSSKGANIESLKLSHSGKRILLEAKNIYDQGRVPHGEEEYLFLYRISNINENGTTAVIEYEGKFVVKGGDMFQSYPDVWGNDSIIEDYSLRTLKMITSCTINTLVVSTGSLMTKRKSSRSKKNSKRSIHWMMCQTWIENSGRIK